MSNSDKIAMIRTLLEIESDDTSENSRISTYLDIAGREILQWRYSYAKQVPEEVPAEFEMTQVFAVLAGFSTAGVENQRSHHEGNIIRIFKHEDMIAYIRANVIPIARCI